MKEKIYIVIVQVMFLFIIGCAHSDPIFMTTIPLPCEKVEIELKSIKTPRGFKVSVYEAHKLAMKPDGIIKPCLSKLEQVIYYDDQYYYFTNSILFYGKTGFPKKFVRVDGRSGESLTTF